MFVPFIAPRSHKESGWSHKSLFKRKGGGGRGRGNTSSGSSRGGRGSSSSASSSAGKGKSSSSSSTSGGSSSSKPKKKTSSSSSSWSSNSSQKKKTVTAQKTNIKSTSFSSAPGYAKAVGVAAVIPAGHMFAGRIGGGGTRDDIYGTRTYGSGYPGSVGRGTSGRGFPFFFWPLTWPMAVGGGSASALYLHNNYEYGAPQNTSRPGGSMAYASFPSISNSNNGSSSTFRFLADNTTVALTILDVNLACGPLLDSSSLSTTPIPFNESSTVPAPEEAIQYYRASSAVLSLDGYNNTATYGLEGAPDSPLPEAVDRDLMACLNETIGANLPLIDGAVGSGPRMSFQLLGTAGLVLSLLSWL